MVQFTLATKIFKYQASKTGKPEMNPKEMFIVKKEKENHLLLKEVKR